MEPEPVEDFSLADLPTGEDPTGEVFAGRREELGELLAALGDARSDRGRLVLVSGESGVDQSRTSQVFPRGWPPAPRS